jgi:cytochrome c biogenesis protein CcmG/thiol:disulfide interchange protein DsbE
MLEDVRAIRLWLAFALAAFALCGCLPAGSAGQGAPTPGGAPSFTLKGLDGRTHSLSDYRGKVVVLNFWATWCIPCRAEMPDLEHEARVHKSDRVAVLGVDWKESTGPVEEFIRGLGVTYPILLDSDGRIYDAYRVSALPTTFVIDRNSRLVKTRLGISSRDEIESEIQAASRG